ncbi:MAG: response regulator [Anaerolineales bacterium]|nr:response regulator [Anaerolineales bacterium]
MSVRILVADDDPFIRQLVVFTLKTRGYEILEASNGAAALALARQTQPDLVVLDVLMPEMTGLQVTKTLSQDPATAHIPIVILSANAQQSDIDAGLASGAVAYLVKPFEPKILAERVAEILERRNT